MEKPDPEYTDEFKRTANRFKMMAEAPLNRHLMEQKYDEWVAAMTDTPEDEEKLLSLDFQINVFGAAVAQALDAELELRADMDKVLPPTHET